MKQPRPFSCLDSRTPRPARGAKKRQRPRIGLDRLNAKTLGELELVAPDLVEEAVGVAAPNKQFNGLFYLLGDYPVDDHAPPGFLLDLGMCGCSSAPGSPRHLDLTGEAIRDGDYAQLIIKYGDARRGQVVRT